MERNNNSTVTTTFGENEVARSGCYVCMRCRTHIALPADNFGGGGLSYRHTPFYGYFRKAINLLEVGPAYYQRSRGQTIASVFCATCITRMGFKYIQVDGTPPFAEFQNGELELEFSRLLLNRNNQLLNALTERPQLFV